MSLPTSPAPEQKEAVRHGEAVFPLQEYTTRLSPTVPDVLAHWHDEAEFTLIRSGRCIYQVQMERFFAEEGDLLFIPPTMLHAISVPNGSMVSDTYVFHMDYLGASHPDLCSIRYLQPLMLQELIPPFHIPRGHALYTPVLSLFTDIHQAWLQGNRGFELVIRARLLELVALLLPFCEEQRQLPHAEHTRKLKAALEYIEAHYTEDITISDVAAACYFSDYHFMRFFKRCTGLSCGEYIKSLRLKKAAEGLAGGENSILDTALSVGFHNLSYFYRSFHKKYGMTPKDFIRQSRALEAAEKKIDS